MEPASVPAVGGSLNLKPIAVLGMFLLPLAFAPVVTAVDGLEAVVLVTPKGRGVGENVEINVETYLHGTLVDVEILDVIIDLTGAPSSVTMTNISTGKYRAVYMIDNNDVHQDEMDVSVSAQIGTAGTFVSVVYDTVATAATGTWELTVRGVGSASAGLWIGPGTNLTFEARSYFNGNLQDGGQINLTSTYVTGTAPTSSALTVTKIQDGVYQATLAVPADLSTSRAYGIEAQLGPGAADPSESTTVMAHPFNAFALVTTQTNTSASLRVLAGGTTPISGATVTLTGTAITSTPPYVQTIGPFTGTTDANGAATINATWTAAQSGLGFWTLSVASGGKTTQMALFLGVDTGDQTWTPDTPSTFGCDVEMQTDPSTLVLGQSAPFKFRVTQDGAAVVSGSITRIIWREGEGATWVAGNATTDASGNFTVTLTVPANWTEDDVLHVSVVCPSWDTGEDLLQGEVGATGGSTQGTKVTVTASGKLGGNVDVTATYTGTNALTGAQAFAAIVPGNQTQITGIGLGGGGLTAPMTKSGSSFSGSVAVPLWMGEGDYTIIVLITNIGATSTLSDQTFEGNMTTIHLTPQGSTGGGGATPGGGFLPGFEAGMVAAAAALAAGVAVAARGRRRSQ
jgi:hypothetical protein